MKRLITILFLCLCAMMVNAQSNDDVYGEPTRIYAVHKAEKESNINPLVLSGKYLKKSAKFDRLEVASFFAAGAAIAITQPSSKKSIKNIGYTTAGVMGVLGLIFHIESIECKWKSGKSLELCGNSLKFNF